jgi:hypothetical protein
VKLNLISNEFFIKIIIVFEFYANMDITCIDIV